MEKRKHYWNGRWGRLARRDVLLFEDGGQWRVEHRMGGADGRSEWAEFDEEDDALDRVRDLLGPWPPTRLSTGITDASNGGDGAAEQWRELM